MYNKPKKKTGLSLARGLRLNTTSGLRVAKSYITGAVRCRTEILFRKKFMNEAIVVFC
jgi:hypothetical protein